MSYLSDKLLVTGYLMLLLSGTVNATDKTATTEASVDSDVASLLDVYKSPSCGCCQKWIDHAEHAGFKITAHNTNSLSQIKAEHGILPQYQSCHTGISKDGFVFEGHIPASIVKRFLANPPEGTIGLAAPGMPMGSPGMEMGNRRDDYDVLLLNSDGSSTIYEQIIAAK
tara:strand:+ start:1303 stop:1809 length:507 start_codon:yes stop_codon:yes gene_type:complete